MYVKWVMPARGIGCFVPCDSAGRDDLGKRWMRMPDERTYMEFSARTAAGNRSTRCG